MTPVLLCGGAGTRLWPASTINYPKPFLAFGDGPSLFQQALLRMNGLSVGKPLIVCHQNHRVLAGSQAQAVGSTEAHYLLEPVGRNTAPAIAFAALFSVRQGDNPVLVIGPSDHLIGNTSAFLKAMAQAAELAQAGHLVVFGVTPTYPETDYGYIQLGKPLLSGHKVARFIEKPSYAMAQRYVDSGETLWNAGLFVGRAKLWLEALNTHHPGLYLACVRAFATHTVQGDCVQVDPQAFAAIPSESIDRAVFEHTTQAAVVSLQAGWTDVGSWDRLMRASPQDGSGNVAMGRATLTACQEVMAYGSTRPVIGVGLNKVLIVETPHTVLVMARDSNVPLARVEASLTPNQSAGTDTVSRLRIAPGGAAWYPAEAHGTLYLIVRRGRADLWAGDQARRCEAGQSLGVPRATPFRITNAGTAPLEGLLVRAAD